ncbi:MAG TPA: hypothetical protein VG298_13270 [Acidimicrobiales bacterium]|jgi:hypothetical protein|nr:hypothetical protein [Acidimicrobiales bacterium]
MTTTPPPDEPDEPPVLATITCPHCNVVVPDARFCGACGANLSFEEFQAAQRLHAFSAFPDEPVIHLSTVTALFPQLSCRAKAPFRLALGLIVSLIVVFALIGADAPLIALCALGVPLLFLLYIWEVDPYEGSFIGPTLTCLVVGAGLGAGWAILGSNYVDQALLPLIGTSLTGTHALVAAVLVPGLGQLLMAVPMLLVWSVQRGPRESLDGFAAGASGALGFTMAATITLMAPWLSNGQLVHQPFNLVFTQAILHGVSVPLVSALTTGLVGAAFWATTGTRPTAARGRWLSSALLALGVALLIQIGLGFCDISFLPSLVVVVVHLVAIAVSIILVRVGIHHVLLHEAQHVAIGPPMVCSHCNHLVPRMLFCPHCGVAERALSRAHRLHHPAPWPAAEGTPAAGIPWPAAPPGEPGVKIGFSEIPAAAHHHRPGHRRMVLLLALGLGVVTLIFAVIAVVAPPGPPAPCRPLTCQGPPVGTRGGAEDAVGTPVQNGVRYANHQGYSLRYQQFTGNPVSKTDATGLTLSYVLTSGATAQIQVVGGPARNTDAQSIVQKIVDQIAPGAQVAYHVPGAMVGYVPGYGEAFNVQNPSSDGSTGTTRLIVMTAIRDGFAISVIAEGKLLAPVTPKSPFWDGHPSPANVAAAYVADPVVNSIAFPPVQHG